VVASVPRMPTTPANWYPDPMGRHDLRFWDGARWTEHVSTAGATGIDHLDGTQPVSIGVAPEKIQQQVERGSARGARGAGPSPPTGTGGGTIFTEPILVVNQKAKVFEVTNQYAVFDRAGNQIASVTQVGQSTAKKALRIFTSLDQFLTHKLEIRDTDGQVQLLIVRPAKVLRSTVLVYGSAGQEIGQIVQDNIFGKVHFTIAAGGQTLGSINAENWRAWNFRIDDATGTEVGRITKTFEGMAKAMFTTADNYVVQIHTQLPQPFLSLVVASALSVDTALKQDTVGIG
jgi:uncharacterized protein YxjI